MDAYTVGPSPTQAHAFLGNSQVFHTFRMNPDTVNWDYTENATSQDTIGGRVVQLLSVNISGMSITGRAGSRGELQRMAENVRQIMEFHIRTSRPVEFKVPSRGWNFKVYVQAMPQVGWDVASTSYPYSMNFAVEEDLTGIQSKKLEKKALSRLYDGIGYNPGFHGGDAETMVERVVSLTSMGVALGDPVEGVVDPTIGGASGPNNGVIRVGDSAPLVEIEEALKAAGMLREGRTCGSNTGANYGYISQHSVTPCNAKDLMVTSGGAATGAQKEDGDNIAAFLAANLKNGSLPISAIIWYRQKFTRNTGGIWVPYEWYVNDVSGRHENHVHVSAYPELS